MPVDVPDEAYAAALSGLPKMTPVRLRALLRRFPPAEAWARLGVGDPALRPDPSPSHPGAARPDQVLAAWRQGAQRDVAALWDRCERAGVTVHLLGRTTYPPELVDDLAAPAVLFTKGDPGVLAGARAAVVGTRNATVAGREVAMLLGAGLARAGVRVVSGLAKGVDGAAHRGALREGGAPPVGVVGSGLDVVYPPEHARLWAEVAERGVLLAEVPPGSAPEAHRFPQRNRIIAALADVVVVVESRTRGGSLHTVEEAQRRGLTVCAVPGSPRNPAAAGTNRLITEGATPVIDPTDVLVAMGFSRPRRLPLVDPRPRPSSDDQAVLDLFDDEPLDLERVVVRSGRTLGSAALALGRLEATGWLVRTGAWFERALVPPAGA
jgi:DNA processing protein